MGRFVNWVNKQVLGRDPEQPKPVPAAASPKPKPQIRASKSDVDKAVAAAKQWADQKKKMVNAVRDNASLSDVLKEQREEYNAAFGRRSKAPAQQIKGTKAPAAPEAKARAQKMQAALKKHDAQVKKGTLSDDKLRAKFSSMGKAELKALTAKMEGNSKGMAKNTKELNKLFDARMSILHETQKIIYARQKYAKSMSELQAKRVELAAQRAQKGQGGGKKSPVKLDELGGKPTTASKSPVSKSAVTPSPKMTPGQRKK